MDFKKNLHYIHIGKTGGTAIKYVLNNNVAKNYNVFLHEHHFKFMDVPYGEKVFFCVRDPVQRFVSAFYSRYRMGYPRYNFPWSAIEEIVFNVFQSPDELAKGINSNNSEIKKIAIQAMQNIGHVKSSYWDFFGNEKYFLERIGDILFICRQENLNEDFTKLKKILGLSKSILLPKNPVIAHIGVNNNKNLSITAINNLLNWYQRDYEFINFLQRNNLL